MSTPAPTDAVELLPCPFCGGKAMPKPEGVLREGYAKHRDDPDAYAYTVRCRACAAESGWTKSPTSAIAAWNRRTPSGATDEALERLDAIKAAIIALKRQCGMVMGPKVSMHDIVSTIKPAEEAVAALRAALAALGTRPGEAVEGEAPIILHRRRNPNGFFDQYGYEWWMPIAISRAPRALGFGGINREKFEDEAVSAWEAWSGEGGDHDPESWAFNPPDAEGK